MGKSTEWQRDGENIKTAEVQYWRNGIMITAQMPRENAQTAVKTGVAYVISAQAIGYLDARGERRG